MDFFRLIQERHSIRKFKPKPIPEAALERILTAANQAPSAGNLQGYRILVVHSPRIRSILAKACWDQSFMAEAPTVLVFCADPARSGAECGRRGKELYCIQDSTIACAYAQLAAAAAGLSSVWVGAVSEPELIRKALRLSGAEQPVAFLPIGYPDEAPEPTTRRTLAHLVEVL